MICLRLCKLNISTSSLFCKISTARRSSCASSRCGRGQACRCQRSDVHINLSTFAYLFNWMGLVLGLPQSLDLAALILSAMDARGRVSSGFRLREYVLVRAHNLHHVTLYLLSMGFIMCTHVENLRYMIVNHRSSPGAFTTRLHNRYQYCVIIVSNYQCLL